MAAFYPIQESACMSCGETIMVCIEPTPSKSMNAPVQNKNCPRCMRLAIHHCPEIGAVLSENLPRQIDRLRRADLIAG